MLFRSGVFRLKDVARPEAAATLAALRGAGMKVHLLSGDASPAVEELGAQLGIDSVRGEASPEHKREFVRELQRHGARVLMVGDGVNDAPVLAQADVSLAMGNGARIAQAESDAVVVSSNLAALPAALAYARRTLRVVRENVAWAFAYNLTVLPLAMAGELSPWAAAIGMSVSSLAVLLNALRLQRPGRKP